jgi:hypothetical protein
MNPSVDPQELPCDTEDGVHDWREERYRYGEDADGNRGTWVYCERCTICGEER